MWENLQIVLAVLCALMTLFLVAGIPAISLWVTIQRKRRGMALDWFQDLSYEELESQLETLHIIHKYTDHEVFWLSFSLRRVGFAATARAMGSWLNHQMREAKDYQESEELLRKTLYDIVEHFCGNKKKIFRFRAIMVCRHFHNWGHFFLRLNEGWLAFLTNQALGEYERKKREEAQERKKKRALRVLGTHKKDVSLS